MMYMSGGGIQIFSIMSVWFLLKQAVSGMMGVDKGASTALTLPARPSRSSSTAADSPSHSCAAFAPYEAASKPKPGAPKTEPQSFLEQKIVYVICQFGLLVRPCSLPCAPPPLSRFLTDPSLAPATGRRPVEVRQHGPPPEVGRGLGARVRAVPRRRAPRRARPRLHAHQGRPCAASLERCRLGRASLLA